jgi:hypothetical protein
MRQERMTSLKADERRFRAMFGTSPFNCSRLWLKLDLTHLPNGARPKHLLWALMFLMLYNTEHILRTLAGGVDEKTYRKWTWLFIDCISELQHELVSHGLQQLC